MGADADLIRDKKDTARVYKFRTMCFTYSVTCFGVQDWSSDMYLVVQVPGAALGGGHQDGGAPHQGQELSDMYLVVQVPGAALGDVHQDGGAVHQGQELSDMYLVVQVPGAALGGGHQDGGAPHQGQDAL